MPATPWLGSSRAGSTISSSTFSRGIERAEVTMAIPPLYILVRLWIHRGLETEFEAYESKVSRIMARYGGVIECAIRTSKAPDGGSDEPFEVHVLRFPRRDLY